MLIKKSKFKKLALALSLCLIILWAVLGTSASLAWFTDTSEKVNNIFHFADFDLAVSYKTDDGTYKDIDGQTDVFDDEALYEPGYVQVVYLKIENKGDLPFDFKAAVNVTDYTVATNVFGQTFNLQKYLKFGVVTADSEAELDVKLSDREAASKSANMPLGDYSTETAELEAAGTKYMALIVRMPEEVANDANFRGAVIPKVELGIIVSAEQLRNN